MSNLDIYEKVRMVPENAKKPIGGGRLKGKTDISPIWRIKTLTELFGPCGIGWKYTIDKQWIEAGAAGVVSCFCNISLYIKVDGAWSEAIPGTGGSCIVAKENSGLYSDDEGFKKALTDAISVACKALGMGADVYWDRDSKYNDIPEQVKPTALVCGSCGNPIKGIRMNGQEYTAAQVAEKTGGKCYKCYREITSATAAQAPEDGYTADDELPF